MRRLVLAMVVVGFVAAGCTPTNPSPTTMSTTSSTAPPQGLREVYLPAPDPQGIYGQPGLTIAASSYPSGAQIIASRIVRSDGGDNVVPSEMCLSATADGQIIPASTTCVDTTSNLVYEVMMETKPVPLQPGTAKYDAAVTFTSDIAANLVGQGWNKIVW